MTTAVGSPGLQDTPARDARTASQSKSPPKAVQMLLPIWGQRFIRQFLEFGLPTLLASSLASVEGCVLLLDMEELELARVLTERISICMILRPAGRAPPMPEFVVEEPRYWRPGRVNAVPEPRVALAPEPEGA